MCVPEENLRYYPPYSLTQSLSMVWSLPSRPGWPANKLQGPAVCLLLPSGWVIT